MGKRIDKAKELAKIVKSPKVPRPNILALGKKISDRMLVPFDENSPEYWALDEVLTDEMAEIGLKMKMRKPYTLDEMVKLTGIEKDHLEKVLEEMAWIGIIEYNWENDLGIKQYDLPPYVMGSGEFFNMNEELLAAHPRLAEFFADMANWPLHDIAHFVPEGGAGIGMHVIPVEKAIEKEEHSISIEKISYWLDKYSPKIAASPCSCRLSRKYVDEGCGDDFHDWCILLGDMATFALETNKASRYITKEEALEIFEKAEKLGFVHEITNMDGEDKIFAICNCNPKVCLALKNPGMYNTPNLVRSAYTARVQTENCVACGQCVQVCPQGAVRLGQKLCLKNGQEQTYPKVELPDDHMKWGEDRFTMDWRDKNRIECYDTGTAPCKVACPAHIGIQGYLKLAAQGKYDEALKLIKKDNPFPAVCGRICNRRCEDECTRGTVDEPIAIDEVKIFLAQRDLDAETRYIPEKQVHSLRGDFKDKIAIIGAGPAGLSCAYYLALAGHHPTVFEKNEKPGGMMTYGIPSFKLEKNVIDAEIDVIKELGVEIKCGVDVGKDVTLDDLRKEGYQAFYLAIGAQGGRKAGVPGEDAEGVTTAVDFLRTALADESYKLKGRVVVIGGGNVAIDVAQTAVRCGADSVRMFSLEQLDEMPALQEEIAGAESDGVTIDNGWGPKEILVKKDGSVKGVILKKCTQVKNAEGRFDPKYDEDDTVTVNANHVILSIGQSIEWGDLLKGSKVEIGRGGRIVADHHTFQTGEPDIFAGGDAYTGPSFVIDAIAEGRIAAESLHRFVDWGSTLTIGRDWRELKELDKDNITVPDYDTTPRQSHGFDPSIDAHKSFRDPRLAFTEEQVKKETARCLSCGASVVDENKCIGCGVCTVQCAFDAIHLHRTHPYASKMVVREKQKIEVLKNVANRAIRLKKEGKPLDQ